MTMSDPAPPAVPTPEEIMGLVEDYGYSRYCKVSAGDDLDVVRIAVDRLSAALVETTAQRDAAKQYADELATSAWTERARAEAAERLAALREAIEKAQRDPLESTMRVGGILRAAMLADDLLAATRDGGDGSPAPMDWKAEVEHLRAVQATPEFQAMFKRETTGTFDGPPLPTSAAHSCPTCNASLIPGTFHRCADAGSGQSFTGTKPLTGYGTRHCRGHWHVVDAASGEDIAGEPNFATFVAAEARAGELNDGEPCEPLSFEQAVAIGRTEWATAAALAGLRAQIATLAELTASACYQTMRVDGAKLDEIRTLAASLRKDATGGAP